MKERIALILYFLLAAGAVSCRPEALCFHKAPIEVYALSAKQTKTIAEGGTIPQSYVLTASAHISDQENARDYFVAHPFTYDSGTWKGSPTIYWPFSGPLDFLCLASEAGGPDLKSLCRWSTPDASEAVSADIPDTESISTELLYGFASLSRTAAPSALEMHHSQALLRFRVSSNAADLIRIDKIEIEDIFSGGTLSIWRDEILSHSWSFRNHEPHALLAVPGSESVVIGTEPGVMDILLPEQEAKNIHISYRRRDYTDDPWDSAAIRKTSIHSPQTKAWWSGNMYEYKMDIKLTEIIFSMELNPWTDAASTVTVLK